LPTDNQKHDAYFVAKNLVLFVEHHFPMNFNAPVIELLANQIIKKA
jgi:hypothetical protein